MFFDEPSRGLPRHVLLFLLLLLFLTTLPTYAQWSKTGFDIPLPSEYPKVYVLPDSTGGFWAAFEYRDYVDPFLPTYIRAQRYNADGVPLFDESGIHVTVDTVNNVCTLAGIANGPGNTLWYLYNEDTPGRRKGVYVQQLQASGERTFGPVGKFVGAEEFDLHCWDTGPFNRVLSDGQGGFWFMGSESLTPYLFVSGVNADGEVKFPLVFVGTMQGVGEAAICTADSGGVFVFWNQYDLKKTRFQHISAEGEKRFGDGVEAPLVVDDVFSGRFSATPDGLGGAYLHVYSAGDWSLVQRVFSDGSTPWPDHIYNYSPTVGVAIATPPATLDDGSILFGIANRNDDFSYNYYISKLLPSGEYSIEPGENSIEWFSSQVFPFRASFYPLAQFPRAFLFLVSREPLNDGSGESDSYVSVRLIDGDSGTDLWGSDHTRLEVPERQRRSISEVFAYLLPDSTILVQMNYANYGETSRRRIYKMRQDGTLVDLVSVSESPATSSLPDRPQILSAWPNPFNASVTITYSLPAEGPAALTIFDLAGREVQRVRLTPSSSEGEYIWRPTDALASGVYFATLESGKHHNMQKLVLLR